MLEDNLANLAALREPIKLPEHPYKAALKSFGLDEVVAGGLDALSVTVLSKLLNESMKTSVLPFAGPVLEKLGFFPIHVWKARELYNSLPPSLRKNTKFGAVLKQELKKGVENLTKDVLLHDPLYVSFMFFGLNYAQSVHPGVLSALSYATAILMVAGIDVLKDEFLFSRKKKAYINAGFDVEKYYESRFCVPVEVPSETVLEKFSKEFKLEVTKSVRYEDIYFANNVPSYSGRAMRVRLRHRVRRDWETDDGVFGCNAGVVNSAQLIYSRAREDSKELDQCRYFPSLKEKIYFVLPDAVNRLEDIARKPIRDIMIAEAGRGKRSINVAFERAVAKSNELAVCADSVDYERPFNVIELKVFKDVRLLKQAMRFLMMNCPVVQTTDGKLDLLQAYS